MATELKSVQLKVFGQKTFQIVMAHLSKLLIKLSVMSSCGI